MGQYPCKSILQENIKAIRKRRGRQSIARSSAMPGGEDRDRQRRSGSTQRRWRPTSIIPRIRLFCADGIRIITRWLTDGKELAPQPRLSFSDHRRVVKKRVMTILNARKDTVRQAAYRDLLRYAGTGDRLCRSGNPRTYLL